MNIYNKLFIKEYSRDPIWSFNGRYWPLNLSFKRYNFNHRNFDLFSIIRNNKSMIWHRNNKIHRLIGPAYIDVYNCAKMYYLNNTIIKIICDLNRIICDLNRVCVFKY